MPDLQLLFKRQLRYILYTLAIFVLGWGFTEYKTVFGGLILGSIMSMFNLWLLARKSIQVGEAAANGKSVRSIGSASRFASAILATIIAMQYPEYFNLISTILGLMVAYVIIVIDFFIHKSNVDNGEER